MVLKMEATKLSLTNLGSSGSSRQGEVPKHGPQMWCEAALCMAAFHTERAITRERKLSKRGS